MTVKEVNPHFEDFLFDWNQKFQSARWRLRIIQKLSHCSQAHFEAS
nr:hypothetical protein [Bacillus licheniformis]